MNEKTKDIFLKIVVPGILAAALVVVAYYGSEQRTLAENYKKGTEAMYKRAFTELCTQLNDLTAALGKLRVTKGQSQNVLLLDDVWRLTGACVSMLSQVPSSHVDTAELNSFLIRVGDYSRVLTKKALGGTAAGEEDMKQLESLYERCREIAADFNDRLSIGDVPIEVITNDEYYTEADDTYKSTDEIEAFPTLIYDGPFSESSEKAEPRGLTGPEVSREDALAAALKLTGLNELEDMGESLGTIPAYDFHGTYDDGREVDISVTKQGGKLLWMVSSATGDDEGVPDDDEAERLKAAGLDWLASNGFGEMHPTYAQYYGGAALINFAAVQDDVILYSDLVKVYVDMETGKVIGADARNYLFSHVARQIDAPTVSPEEAEAAVSVNLHIDSRELALIPITPETEVLCYEFKGTCMGDDYIVYINAQTGTEEQVLQVIDNGTGQLTM